MRIVADYFAIPHALGGRPRYAVAGILSWEIGTNEKFAIATKEIDV